MAVSAPSYLTSLLHWFWAATHSDWDHLRTSPLPSHTWPLVTLPLGKPVRQSAYNPCASQLPGANSRPGAPGGSSHSPWERRALRWALVHKSANLLKSLELCRMRVLAKVLKLLALCRIYAPTPKCLAGPFWPAAWSRTCHISKINLPS